MLTQTQGGNVRMTVTPRGFVGSTTPIRADNQFVLEVKPVKEDPNKLTQGIGKARFGGEKLSLNFQNIDKTLVGSAGYRRLHELQHHYQRFRAGQT